MIIVSNSLDINQIDINYGEAQNLIDLKEIKESHDALDKSINDLEEIILSCNNTNFTEFNATLNDIPENIESLIPNTDEVSPNLIEALKPQLDLYHSKYESLSKEVTSMNEEALESINNFISPKLLELKNDLNNITINFEKRIKRLAIPFKLNLTKNRNNLRNLDDNSDDKIIEDIFSMLKEKKDLYDKVLKIFDIWIRAMKVCYQWLDYINIRAMGGIIDFNSFIGSLGEIFINEVINKLRDDFFSVLGDYSNIIDMIDLIFEELIKSVEELKNFFESFLRENHDIVEELNRKIKEICENNDLEIFGLDLDLENIYNSVVEKIDLLVGGFNYLQTLFKDITRIYDVKSLTSVDLLFIIDLSDTNQPYVNTIKTDLINIIQNISSICQDVTMNIGFIEYRYSDEKYLNIDFTENLEYIKRIINHIGDNFGGETLNEDISLFELALIKNLDSNTKIVIYVSDSLNHEEKFSGSLNKYQRIQNSILQMVDNNINLFCVKINEKTDNIYSIFQNIFRTKNNKFSIIDMTTSSLKDEVVNYFINVYNNEIYYNEFCLVPKEKAISILKSEYGITNKNPDDNLRFILGKCNPILLIPGVYSTKLVVELNCKGIAKNEKDTTLKDIRLYCGLSVCLDESKTSEEHSLLFSLLDDSFGIKKTNELYYGSCLGHIASYYMNDNECPKINGKKICYHSDYIKIGYYGSTPETLDKSRCGVEATTNVIQTGELVVDRILNHFAGVSDVYNTIAKNLITKGYKEGFSLGAIPNDYRRYLSSNNFASNSFREQINRLYKNTGKPVVIVAHSYGTLLTLTNLLKNKGDKEFIKKIKKFVALAPPFSGSTKLLDIFLHGTKDFNVKKIIEITHYHSFGQFLMYKSLPTMMELRPQSIAAKIFTEPEYSELGNSLKERLEIENKCKNKDCTQDEIKEKTSSFDNIFKGYFPSLLDKECSYESSIGGNQETFNRKCYTNIYDVGNCPTIVLKSAYTNKNDFEKEVCGKYEKTFYQGECESGKDCLDKVYYSDKCPYVFNDKEPVKFLISRFNTWYFLKYGIIDESYFETHEFIRNSFKKSIEYQNDISMIKDLPVPPIDTDLLYATFYPTMASLVLEDDDFTKDATKIYNKGGDETVQSWSSLLTGLKWIYDIKKKNLPQKFRLIEYCSRLAKSGQYKYNPTKNQNFAALACRCLDANNVYKNEEEIKKCSHAQMLQDENLYNYIYSVANNPREILESSAAKIQAVKEYNPKNDYENICNNYLYDIFQTNNYSRSYISDRNEINQVHVLSKSICKIEYIFESKQKLGRGVLVNLIMPDINYKARGIITTNFVLDLNKLYSTNITLICDNEKIIKYIIPGEHITFSDNFIDITFIELNNPEFDKLRFIQYEKVDIKSKDVYIFDNLKEMTIYNGKINEKYGFKLYNEIWLKNEYCGSALFSEQNNVIIGIYSNKRENTTGNPSRIAINMEKAFEGIEIILNSSLYNKSLAFIEKDNLLIQRQIKNLTIEELNILSNQGLSQYSIPGIFIRKGNLYVTDLWFYRTNYAWYWTPVEPNEKNYQTSNWLIICEKCSLKVIGSKWNGEEPVDSNIKLINWLAATGLEYLVDTLN